MASYLTGSEAFTREKQAAAQAETAPTTNWADKFRGATIEDLDPPPALSISSHDPIATAIMAAYERDYTHLTVISSTKRSLLGYLSIPRLKELLQSGAVKDSDSVSAAMQRFNRKRGTYQTITMETPLEELRKFFDGETHPNGEKQQFAVVTDQQRKFVLGVATKEDLEEFVKRRPT
ncbi:unnamed protein product [Penicillium salamii]|uniref:Cystathionine beta-synthase n=1 Tax=Penicillium salamii TaxID=1612424 RepID=A0A9W4NKG0_9EURO|nr:unnamed protein product [Penicillium salamii]CAG7983662.1 unnamed protein product [Penicillium salamii]CAG8165101.1 unnamed protein product [Penicillium salamii]CAG8236773.1 unnamed protein product [Penicillium salamii]CAG8241814.1 unnamed protein product [Penicillium salamii]